MEKTTTNFNNTGISRLTIRIHVAAHGEASCANVHIILISEAECNRHIVDDPMMLVVKAHAFLEEEQLL